MPDELAAQMPVLKELLAALGYREVTAEGWEADDILGTLSAACAARSDDCFLATGDRDSLQLVSDTHHRPAGYHRAWAAARPSPWTWRPSRRNTASRPRQLIDIKSLMGDASDNIPGVKGIGEKSAVTLIQKYGSLAGVYAHLDDTADKAIKPKQREHLAEDRAMAELSYTLGTIRTDAPIDTAEGAYVVGEGNKAEAVRLMQELELHSLITRFGLSDVAPAADPAEGQRRAAAGGRDRRSARRAEGPLPRGGPACRHGKAGHPHRGAAARRMVCRAGQDRLPAGGRRPPPPAGQRGRHPRRLRQRPSLRPCDGGGRLGQQHRLGRQAGGVSAGRFGLEVQPLRADHPLPRRRRLHL